MVGVIRMTKEEEINERVELLKAWAYGAEIEVYDAALEEWRDLNGTGFHHELKYRLKDKEK